MEYVIFQHAQKAFPSGRPSQALVRYAKTPALKNNRRHQEPGRPWPGEEKA